MEPKYTAADLTVLDPIEAILARPKIYFGDLETWEWPLAMVAMALGVSGRGRESVRNRMATLRPDGGFEATFEVDDFEWARTAAHQDASTNLLARSWWRIVCLTYRVSQRDMREFATDQGTVSLVRSSGTFTVVAMPDPSICLQPDRWWLSWRDRLEVFPAVIGAGPEFVDVTTVDESASVKIQVGGGR